VVADLARERVELPILDGDLDIISAPIDVLGVNYYFSQKFTGYAEDGSTVDADGLPVSRTLPLDKPRTAMDWEIVPEGFTDLLVGIARDYPGLPMVITENGSAFEDVPDATGFVDDTDRTAYFASHLAAVAEAVRQGADIRGYLAWSLMDNFEWAYGYAKRFGIVRVDYETQTRTPKASATYLKSLAEHYRAAHTVR
jgi:beta-glucosidase